MKHFQDVYPLVRKVALSATAFDFTIHCKDVAAEAEAGQFVNLRCGEKMLRRPISICQIDKKRGNIRLVFEVRGEGTKWLASLKEGDSVDMLAPLGRGFSLAKGKTIVVGGGIGVPPLLEVVRQSEKAEAILGFRSKEFALLKKDFERECDTFIATEDGTMGIPGLVTDVLRERLKAEPCAMVSACGPTPMLKAVAAIAQEFDVPCQVSMEERMGCGVGACLVCACKTKNKENGEDEYSRVCKEGPVFDAKEVRF